MRRRSGFRVHLIDKNPFHTLKPQLHEAAVRRTPVIIPIRNIIAGRNIIFHLEEISKIALRQKILQVGRKRIRFGYYTDRICRPNEKQSFALPGLNKIAFIGFIGRLSKTTVREKHLRLLSKESPKGQLF